MSERIPHGRNRLPLSAVATAILVLCANAQAQQAAEPAAAPATEQKKDELLLERVEITGSIIRRVSQESALPVTSISATELEKRGHTELKEYVLELPQASSLGTSAERPAPSPTCAASAPCVRSRCSTGAAWPRSR